MAFKGHQERGGQQLWQRLERGLKVGIEKRMDLAKDKEAQKILFNQRARV